MKRLLLVVISILLAWVAPSGAQAASATLAADTFVSSTSAANFGKRKQVWVQGPSTGESAQSAYLLFDLSVLPFGTAGSDVAKATLTLGVGRVRSPGSFDVFRILGPDVGEWTETGLTASNAPTMASAPEVSGVALSAADKSGFKAVDVTSLVRDWLDGTVPNNGVALVPNTSPLNVAFDSKETTSTGHYARLEITLGAVSNFSGPLDGDVTGSQSATKVTRINGSPLAPLGGVQGGQVLTFLGSTWGPGNVVSSLLAGAGLSLSAANGDITVGIPTGALTNDLLANPAFDLITGAGLGGGGQVPLGGSLSLLNTGVLSLGALAPLATTGGQNPSISLTGLIPLGNGGTGAASAAGALANLGAAGRGVNSDITSLAALATPLTLAQGGTGSNNAAAALSNLGAAGRGVNSDITSMTGLTGVNANILTVLTSLPVYINSSGVLGVVGSSARFKQDIVDMGDATRGLMQLRPVRFRYTPGIDPSGLEQYGLVAEEVARVYPDLVAYDTDGQPLTVRYQALTPMLLNEVQRQARQIGEQQRQLSEQEERLQVQALQVGALTARLEQIEASMEKDRGGRVDRIGRRPSTSRPAESHPGAPSL